MRLAPVLAVAAAIGIAGSALADVPDVVTFSGVLFGDQQCCGFSYEGPVTVRLFGQAEGGGPLWEETHPDVAVDMGYFAVDLGSVVPLDPAVLNLGIWLEVELKGEGPLAPRLPLTSVPFALRAGDADRLQGHEAEDFALSDHEHDGYVQAGATGSVTADMLAPGAVSTEALGAPPACGPGEVLKRNADNSAWLCAPDADTLYWPGLGLLLNGEHEFSLDGPFVEALAGGVCYDSPEELWAELDERYAPGEHWHDQDYVNEEQKGSISTPMIQDGAVTLAKLAGQCQPGQVPRMTPAGWACSEASQGVSLSDLACQAGQVA
jgi:hypothetical protein